MAEDKLVTRIAKLLDNKKAQNLLALRVAHLTTLADYLVIATGHNRIQTRALCDHLDKHLSQSGLEPRRIEGRNDGTWIVMDYAEVIVHLFIPDARGYYRLERLWDDGQNRVELAFLEPVST
ncbi:MAG: ribosome silencing factor [Clostridiales bacterium]|nr:ribosome silencing factor [Clostridiales bacterium]